jgi:hypothetical protein
MKDCDTPRAPGADGRFAPLGEGWKECAITQDAEGRRFRWTDPDRMVHAVELWPVQPGFEDTTANTRCGVYDVPPGEAHSGDEGVDCWICAGIEHVKRLRFHDAPPMVTIRK